MGAANGGQKWTLEEEEILRREWMAGTAMGRKPIVIIKTVANKIGRTVASVTGKAQYMMLTRSQAKLVAD